MKKLLYMAMVLVLMAGVWGCASMSGTAKGGAIGAGAGGAIGGVIGNQSGNTATGAIIGAVIGGAAGAYIGNYMDDQAEEIEQDLEGATVERIGEGIKITFDSGLLFDVDAAGLKTVSETNLTNLAVILEKYDDTEILLEGHTDATGSEEHNLNLSRNRAHSVANHLAQQGVMETRMTIMGYGETQPIAPNDTVDGRTMNRRVEVAIYANDKLKDAAEEKVEE
jgi:outer membrane protein OmpA-like peptidoglycan-associated protein